MNQCESSSATLGLLLLALFPQTHTYTQELCLYVCLSHRRQKAKCFISLKRPCWCQDTYKHPPQSTHKPSRTCTVCCQSNVLLEEKELFLQLLCNSIWKFQERQKEKWSGNWRKEMENFVTTSTKRKKIPLKGDWGQWENTGWALSSGWHVHAS